MKPAPEEEPSPRENIDPGDASNSVCVLALSDLGQSPRMQFHALALANAGARVHLIGVAGHPLYPAVRDHPRVFVHALAQRGTGSPAPETGLGYLARTCARLVRQAFALVKLFRLPKSATLLVQSPPAVPALPVAWLACRLRGMRFVIDWHNLGFTMLALRLEPRHPAVQLARYIERVSGARADEHLCVSQSLRQRLVDEFGIEGAVVFYDKPPALLRRATEPPPDRAAFFRRAFGDDVRIEPGDRVLVSPTSWSLDENLELILEAAALYRDREALPSLRIFLTGDGPGRKPFEQRLAHHASGKVMIRTGWLKPEDYASLLALADLGICCHTSSSKSDLPMKIADMLAARLPVCAFDFGPCLREQFIPDRDGWLFCSATELAELWVTLLDDETGKGLLGKARATLAGTPMETWEHHWRQVAAPLLLPRDD